MPGSPLLFPVLRRLALGASAVCCWLMAFSATEAQEMASSWTARETRLANEYLSLLVKQPDYGRVVDLLWDLYQKHDATALLLENVSVQAQANRHPTVLLVQGHLLRRAGQKEQAAALYDEVLEKEPQNRRALRSRADLAREMADPKLAYELIHRWLEQLEETDPTKAGAWMEAGTLALAMGDTELAAQAWEAAAALKPTDTELARQVAERLMRAGLPERAAAFYSRLTQQQDPRKKLEALYDLARILELTDDYAQADAALREGLLLLDFRDGRYEEFFRRRVRLHERFGRLDELREELRHSAGDTLFSERAWRDLGRFYEITVETEGQMEALKKLVSELPGEEGYRWELVRVLLDHEGAAEAAKLLDERMLNDGSDSPALVLIRCEADLRQGKPSEAAKRLETLLRRQGGDAAVEKQVLVFAQNHALDKVVEHLLESRVQREPSRSEAVFELAGFYRARNRLEEAQKLLRDFTDGASQPQEKQQRLNDASAFLASGSDLATAVALAREAAGHPGAGREEWVRLADLLAEQEESEEAVVLLEKAWQASQTDEDRLDVDDRLYAVLMGDVKSENPDAGTAGDFKLPDAFTGRGFASGNATAVEQAFTALPEAVLQKAREITGLAAQEGRPEWLLRGAWWSLRTDLQTAYQMLLRLQTDPATGQMKELPVEAEKLLLDLALADKNRALAMRVLRRLRLRDEVGKIRYTLRLSELMMEAEQAAVASIQNPRWLRQAPSPLPVAEATHLLEQTYREHPESDQLLSALTQAYTVQKRPEEALRLWSEAIARAPGGSAISLLERYSQLLLQQNRLEAHVQAEMQILERETDVKRRRDSFKRFADRLLWASEGSQLADAEARSRLDMLEKALAEQSRKHPFDGFYHEGLALVYGRKGKPDQAFKAMKQAYYTSPETPFSLGQLREAALQAGDVSSAIYFQKQVAAMAPPGDLAAEARRLVELLEQTFQMEEADRVRRRLESRFSQDVTALENLADHYRQTGQDEAERRVYEQIARVRPWDAHSQLRIALKCLRLAEDEAAERHLEEILDRTQPQAWRKSLKETGRLPLPLSDVRKAGAAGPVTEILALLDTAPGLETRDVNRLRAFLNLQRPELMELPDAVDMVRLRAIEELARLKQRSDAAAAWQKRWQEPHQAPVERLWALYYADAGEAFRGALRAQLTEDRMEVHFCHVWLLLRSHGMKAALDWVRLPEGSPQTQTERQALLLACAGMLAELEHFRFEKGELAMLGEARLLSNASILAITRDLQERQRYPEALELGESLRRHSTSLSDDYAFFLSRIAESAERWDLAREYLDQVVRGPVQPGSYRGTYDPYLYSLSTASRLAPSEQAREETLRAAWKRLQRTPDSALTQLRKSAVAGLAGAEDVAAEKLVDFITGDFIGSRRMGEPPGMLMPQGSTRYEEPGHLRLLWEETREIQAGFVQQGLAGVVHQANDKLTGAWGTVGFSARTGQEFTEWRLGHLSRQLRKTDYPARLRLIREYLAGVEMRQETAVEMLGELGGRLESQGMAREAIELYRQLPPRAPANPEYAQSLIRACESARETTLGRAFTLQLLQAEPPFKPPQPGNEELAEKHAWFLAQDFDLKELRERGFHPPEGRVLRGRIPPEVPYLRELALLHERLEQKEEAFVVWGRLFQAYQKHADNGLRPEPESCLHLARLLKEKSRDAEALECLRFIFPKDAQGQVPPGQAVREVLKLRAGLAADAGLWPEVQELMALAVDKKLLDVIAHLAGVLAGHDRQSEALNLLTQAERRTQTDNERFYLRLELLKRLAASPDWTPARARPQLSALFRSHNRDRVLLMSFAEWMSTQAGGPNVAAWQPFLRAECRAGADRPLAALALASLADQLPDGTGEDLAMAWKVAKEGDRICLELAAEFLLKAGRADWAWEACLKLQELPTLRLDGRKLPLMVRVAHARKDTVMVQELFAEVVRRNVPGGTQPAEWARAFEECGQPVLAREIYQQALTRLESTQSMQPDVAAAWVRFLIRQGESGPAELYLMKNHWQMVAEAPALLFELYQAWGKVALMEAELAKYHLPRGVLQEALFLGRRSQGLSPPAPQP